MGARKKPNVNSIEITKITHNIKIGKVSSNEMRIIRSGLQLLKRAQDSLLNEVNGDEVHSQDVSDLGHQVGARLRAARIQKTLGQDELAKLSRISQSSISKIERGLKMISIKEAKALGKALDVRPQFLIAGE